MSELPEPSQEIAEWLAALRLSQYAAYFQRAGYRALKDCERLTDEQLLALKVFPTGHRRRVLRSLEALGVKEASGGEEGGREKGGEEGEEEEASRKPVPHPRRVFLKDKRRVLSCQQQPKDGRDREPQGSQTLPLGAGLGTQSGGVQEGGDVRPAPPRPAPRDPQNIQRAPPERPCVGAAAAAAAAASFSASSTSSCESLSVSEISSDWDMSSEGPSFPEDSFVFQGDMVDNCIYQATAAAPRRPPLSRSYRLRNRPVPRIPEQAAPPLPERSTPPARTSSTEHLATPEAPLRRTPTLIAPYGELFLYNNPESTPDRGAKDGARRGVNDKKKPKKQRKKKPERKQSKQEDLPPAPAPPGPPDRDEYAAVTKCVGAFNRSSPATPEGPAAPMVECELYSEAADAPEGGGGPALPDISPYACFYGAPKHQVLKVGWLDKLSPQGKCVFQRRWVRFDGLSLAYYNNDKEMYSKGMILASAVRQVRALGDNKFEVVTALRTFTFRAEREGERQEWLEALQTASRPPPACGSQKRHDSLSRPAPACKRGPLELRGYKGRVLVSLEGSRVRLCKTEQDYKAGLAIAELELTAANIRDVDRRGFEVNTPFKNFCFTAESEGEKEEWIEAVQESIAETLSDYEVAEKIWFNEANRSCADCRAPRPEWASVNLGVVVCKKCAGQHRSLGPSISKVRSLKLDSSIWSNELVELFLEAGNKNANGFWAANLPPEEEIHSGASVEQRATFIRRKYRERKYRRVLQGFPRLEHLNQALCASVVSPDLLRTMALVFSGADVMCATGDPASSTPYLLAQRAGQKLQMEFLHQNKLSDFPRLEQWSESPSPSDASLFMDGFLYISAVPAKTSLDRRGRDDMARRWCTLEAGSLSYYESERSAAASGRVDVSEVVSLAVSHTETMTGAGAVFTAELYLRTERVLVVGAETQETQRDWIQALTKCFVPPHVEGLLLRRRDAELIGRLHYKEGHDLYHWRLGWFALESSVLHFSCGEEAAEEVLQLKQLQELTVSMHTEGEDKIQVLLMVEGGRTIYIHGFNKTDFALWYSAITLAAGTDGKALGDQQLTKNGVPIAVDSCIAFVTQYGLCQEGLYQRPGDPGRVALLLQEFRRDARNVKLRREEHQLEDVTDTLKSFLSQAEDALLTKELYPYWVSALDEEDERRRVKKYSTFIESLPKINRSTLDAVLQHLYRIQQCSDLNHMPGEKLASVFSARLFQTRGQTPQEIRVVHDLISNYVKLFSVNESRVQQMEIENSFITRWNEKKDATFSPAGDLIFEVYLEKKEPENCCLIKVSPGMRSAELAESALSGRNAGFGAGESWTVFEVIEHGELERPLHPNERILEQVLEWSTLDFPRSAFLVIKKFSWDEAAGDEKDQGRLMKADYLKFSGGSSKLLSGPKFQEKYVVLRADKLLLYRDIKGTKAEKVIQLSSVKCYFGLRKKLKPPTSWGFTIYTDKQQWHFCCETRAAQVGWVTGVVRMTHGADLRPREAARPKPGGRTIPRGTGTQPTDERIPHADGRPAPTMTATLPRGTNAAANRADPRDLFKPPQVPQRRASADAGRPQQPPPPSRHTKPLPLPLPAQSGCRRPLQGAEVSLPPNLLSELNSVLSKTSRAAKTDD